MRRMYFKALSLLPRRIRPIDLQLFGEALLSDEQYVRLLRFIADSSNRHCTMSDLKDRFARGTKGSMLYYMVARLERAKLLKIRSDGVRNFLELTPTAQQLLGLTTEDR